MTGTSVSKKNHALVAQSLWIPKPRVKRSEPIQQPALADCPLISTFHGRQLVGIFINSARSRNTVEKHRMNCPLKLNGVSTLVVSCSRILTTNVSSAESYVTCDEKWYYFKSRQTKSMVSSWSSGETCGQT
jgi:hypothetical protein